MGVATLWNLNRAKIQAGWWIGTITTPLVTEAVAMNLKWQQAIPIETDAVAKRLSSMKRE